MTYTIRVSLPGYNALTDTNPDHYALYADNDWVLIKEKARGSGSVDYLDSVIISHNLGYVPLFMVFCKVDTGEYRVCNAYDPIGSGWKAYSDNSDLVIENDYSSTYTDYKYYIFYDEAA